MPVLSYENTGLEPLRQVFLQRTADDWAEERREENEQCRERASLRKIAPIHQPQIHPDRGKAEYHPRDEQQRRAILHRNLFASSYISPANADTESEANESEKQVHHWKFS